MPISSTSGIRADNDNYHRATREHLSRQERLERYRQLADLMDSRFVIPGIGYRIGLDSLLGFIPGVGDAISGLVSAYLIREAHHMGAPFSLKMRMGWNVLLDTIIGSIPLMGDIFDIGFKANRRNLRLLERHLSRASDIHLRSS
jgi:hypothetical protein